MVLVGANRIAQRVGKNSQLVHGAQKKPTGWWAVGWMAVPFGCWVWGELPVCTWYGCSGGWCGGAEYVKKPARGGLELFFNFCVALQLADQVNQVLVPVDSNGAKLLLRIY